MGPHVNATTLETGAAPGLLAWKFLKDGFTTFLPSGHKKSVAVALAASMALGMAGATVYKNSRSATPAGPAVVESLLRAEEAPGAAQDTVWSAPNADAQAMVERVLESAPPTDYEQLATQVEEALRASAQVHRNADGEVLEVQGSGITALIDRLDSEESIAALIERTDAVAAAPVVTAAPPHDDRRAATVDLSRFEEYELNPDIIRALRVAGTKTGTDPAFIMAIASKESTTFDTEETTSLSSATGILQFTNVTWMRAIKMFGERHGLGYLSDSITDLGDGRMAVKKGMRDQVLKLRHDATISAVMAAEYWNADRERLREALRIEPKPVDIYMTHLLGWPSAIRFIKAVRERPSASSQAVVPVAVRNNGPLFRAGSKKDGDVLSVGGAYRQIERTIESRYARYSELMKADIGHVSVAPPGRDAAKAADKAANKSQPPAAAKAADKAPVVVTPVPRAKPKPPAEAAAKAPEKPAAAAAKAPEKPARAARAPEVVGGKVAERLAQRQAAREEALPAHKPRRI